MYLQIALITAIGKTFVRGSNVALYLKKYGHKLLDNGYEVLAITPGGKFPIYDFSAETLPKITPKIVNGWLANGHAKDGIGIRSRYTPMIDIDCKWEPLVLATVAEAEDKIGYAPRRIGEAPKVGLIYRSNVPFRKVQSKAFTDPDGRKCQLEIQGDGQQWVAYAIHPGTKKPYRWPDEGFNILDVPHDELAVITAEQALELVQWFEAWCINEGWARWKSNSKSTALTTISARDPDDIGGAVRLELPIEEVRDWVSRLENDEDVEYEDNYNLNPEKPNYRNVLFAIWFETDGSAEGREIAMEWSEKSSKHEKEPGRFFKMWNSADPGDRDDPVTFKYVIKCVNVQEESEKKEQRDDYLDALRNCSDADDLAGIAEQITKIRFEGMDFDRLAQELKKAYHRITGFQLSIAEARKLLYHRPAEDELPQWVKPWVYIRHTGVFYSRTTGEEVEHKMFDAAYSRYLNGASAVQFALNKAQIKTYYMQMYKPDDDEEFWFQGHECINTFSDRLMPEMPETFGKKDKLAIAIVEAHFEHIIPDARERKLLISYLAYTVQTRQRINWTVVLQGVEGDGKSFIGAMMGAILGSSNVRQLDAQQLEDRYTGWAVGQLMTFIEELRLQGHSRYDILNKIKPFITNEAVNVHPKNVNPYTALNTTSYVAFTNFRDALPLDDNDRRHMILASAWQSGETLRKFLLEEPTYFEDLWGTINGDTARPGALRKWLMEYELHSEFDPKSRAPLTEARKNMVELNKSEVQTEFEDLIASEKNPRVSLELVVASALVNHMDEAGVENFRTKAVTLFLLSNGYVKLPHRIRMSSDSDNVESIYVKDPSAFNTKKLSWQRRDVLRFIKARTNHEDEV